MPPRVLPYYTEHKMVKTPEIVYLDPRCKTGLVHNRQMGTEVEHQCTQCGNGEPGIPYVQVSALKAWALQYAAGFKSPKTRAAVNRALGAFLQKMEVR